MIRSRIGVRSTFGDRLRWARQRLRAKGRRLTQEELARAVGVERNTVSRWENGGMLPKDPAVIGALAAVLDVTADWLIGGEPADDPAHDPADDPAEAAPEPAPESARKAGQQSSSARQVRETASGPESPSAEAAGLPGPARRVVRGYLDRMRQSDCVAHQIDGAESILIAGARNRVSSIAFRDRTDEHIAADIDAAWDLVVRILRREGVRL
jgi:transcriptional regulator with XRE-family HTH domain